MATNPLPEAPSGRRESGDPSYLKEEFSDIGGAGRGCSVGAGRIIGHGDGGRVVPVIGVGVAAVHRVSTWTGSPRSRWQQLDAGVPSAQSMLAVKSAGRVAWIAGAWVDVRDGSREDILLGGADREARAGKIVTLSDGTDPDGSCCGCRSRWIVAYGSGHGNVALVREGVASV